MRFIEVELLPVCHGQRVHVATHTGLERGGKWYTFIWAFCGVCLTDASGWIPEPPPDLPRVA